MDGFNYADITDYAQSEATFTHYYNYRFCVPNEDMHITKSGNYVLQVYEQDDPDVVLFQTRFSVCENTVHVQPVVTSRTDIDYNESHQQLEFDVVYRQGLIADPYQELTAIITQNTRLDNAVMIKRPMMVAPGKITYAHVPELIFAAGNEWRRFETVNTHTINMHLDAIRYFEPYYHATVSTDFPRSEGGYLYDRTQFGRFTIRNAEFDETSDTQADYLVTHFTLDVGRKLEGGELHLDGEFTQGLPREATLMKYDEYSGCYTCDMLLKQGAYNYQYLWYPYGSVAGETAFTEGDKYQTVNEYVIRIYDHPSGERYDHFVGYGVVYSGK